MLRAIAASQAAGPVGEAAKRAAYQLSMQESEEYVLAVGFALISSSRIIISYYHLILSSHIIISYHHLISSSHIIISYHYLASLSHKCFF